MTRQCMMVLSYNTIDDRVTYFLLIIHILTAQICIKEPRIKEPSLYSLNDMCNFNIQV